MRSPFPFAAVVMALSLAAAGPAAARPNGALVTQQGSGLSGAIIQSGSGNYAALYQRGADNSATIRQDGDGNTACFIQLGQNLDATLTQSGGATGTFLQTRGGAKAVPSSVCAPGRFGLVKAPPRANGPVRPGMTWTR